MAKHPAPKRYGLHERGHGEGEEGGDTEIDGKTIIKLKRLRKHTFHITYFLTCLFKCTTRSRQEAARLCTEMDLKRCSLMIHLLKMLCKS